MLEEQKFKVTLGLVASLWPVWARNPVQKNNKNKSNKQTKPFRGHMGKGKEGKRMTELF